MQFFPLATIGEAAAAGFGAMGGLVLIGGGVMLRWQKNKLQYAFLHAALEKGVSALPGVPMWLMSLRQGVMIFVLGIGIFLGGAAVFTPANKVQMPATADVIASAEKSSPPREEESLLPPDRRDRPEDNRPHPRPPAPNPVMESWHRAQDQKAVGTAAMFAGFVLVLLGLVRIIFSLAERKFAGSATEPL